MLKTNSNLQFFLIGFFKDLWTSCLTNLCGMFKG